MVASVAIAAAERDWTACTLGLAVWVAAGERRSASRKQGLARSGVELRGVRPAANRWLLRPSRPNSRYLSALDSLQGSKFESCPCPHNSLFASL